MNKPLKAQRKWLSFSQAGCARLLFIMRVFMSIDNHIQHQTRIIAISDYPKHLFKLMYVLTVYMYIPKYMIM